MPRGRAGCAPRRFDAAGAGALVRRWPTARRSRRRRTCVRSRVVWTASSVAVGVVSTPGERRRRRDAQRVPAASDRVAAAIVRRGDRIEVARATPNDVANAVLAELEQGAVRAADHEGPTREARDSEQARRALERVRSRGGSPRRSSTITPTGRDIRSPTRTVPLVVGEGTEQRKIAVADRRRVRRRRLGRGSWQNRHRRRAGGRPPRCARGFERSARRRRQGAGWPTRSSRRKW